MNADATRIVVADDEPDVRTLLSFQLGDAGHNVVAEAADGAQAIEACASARPDLIVLDLLMPALNGFEVIPILQRDHPGIAVVAYTAVAGEFVRREMQRFGIPLVLKSGVPDALLAAIESLTRSGA